MHNFELIHMPKKVGKQILINWSKKKKKNYTIIFSNNNNNNNENSL